MSINGELISEEQVVKYLNEVTAFSEANKIPSTFFELTEGVAFRYFSEGGVDVVVLETGLGGLTDPTNVISNPALSIVTSIGLEHTEYLGDTIELIGRQKAGIIKRNCPVLVGPNVPHETIRQCAVEREAEGYYTCEDVLGPDVLKNNEEKKKVFDYDLENSRTAQAALTLLRNKKKEGVIDSNFPSSLLSDDIIAQGIQHRPTCRFEIIKNGDNIIILDVAHNPQGMMNLVEKLEATYPGKNKRFVVGMSAEKDVWSICNILLDVVPNPSNIHLVEAVNDRAATIQTILDAQPKLLKSNFAVKDRSVTAQIKLAMEIAAKNDEVVVVCGSVFLMSEARQALGIEEARDSEKIFDKKGH
jgi:dihydrofolate synthase/folylpolyglutamate synthase